MSQNPHDRDKPVQSPLLQALREGRGAMWDRWPWLRDAWSNDTLGATLPDEPFLAFVVAFLDGIVKGLEDITP